MLSKASNNNSPCDTPAGELEQLRQEVSELRNTLEMRTQENALLNEVISTVGSTLRMEEVLRHLVDTVVRATSCQVAFIYLYDKDKERLVLAAASKQYHHLVGKLSMALGEGIAGWVALHREMVYLKEGALEDPRFCYFPELEEEKYQSIMTVPIISKDRQLTGIITVQAFAPHEFTDQHRAFINNTAALVAGALENARLYENTQRKLGTLTSLSVLSQTISSGLYLDEMLRTLATLTVQIMEVDQCVIMLMEPAREREADVPRRLTVRATAPTLNERAQFRPIDVDRGMLEEMRAMSESSQRSRSLSGPLHHGLEIHADALERLNPFQDRQYQALISAPLIAGAEQLGLINCYTNRARRFSSEDQTLLTTVANQAAIAIKNSYLVNQLTQKNVVKSFFDDLMQGTTESEELLRQRAHFLGCDLNKSHTAVIVEVKHINDQGLSSLRHSRNEQQSQTGENAQGLQVHYKRIGGVVRRRIQDNYPGSVCYEHENVITCIIPASKDQHGIRLKGWLNELSRQMQDEYDVCL
ncbi:MAG: GAF domain-containing protein, partial [Ktedonobacteraceae bacterium]|nr:GAF domain-containing protein [Ktedonobacteraceae bacterium]